MCGEGGGGGGYVSSVPPRPFEEGGGGGVNENVPQSRIRYSNADKKLRSHDVKPDRRSTGSAGVCQLKQ